MWPRLYKSTDAVSRVLAWISGGLIFLIAFLQLFEILLRNVANISLSFVWEFAAYMHIAAIFLGLSMTLRTGGHIQVTLLATVMPRVFQLMSTLGGLLFSGYLSFALIQLAWNWGATGRTSGTVDDIPLVIPISFVAFGAVMLTVQLCLRLFHILLGTPTEIQWSSGPSAE
ncbi:TRAP transporter small permease [Celeribacter sp.]|uniref:TRAP transporter small permease n=1 Tax=Celeribacter sp. TaxID=1890673 RepID=UPI003A920A6E